MSNLLKNFLDTLSDQEIDAIVASYSKFQIMEDFRKQIQSEQRSERYFLTNEVKQKSFQVLQQPRLLIKRLLEFDGCIYDGEITSQIKCLTKEIEKYRQGEDIRFDPHIWETLMTIEKLFDVTL